MNKKLLKGIVCSLLCVAMTVGVGIGLNRLIPNTATAEAVWHEGEIKGNYSFGEEFVFPEASVTVGGKTVKANMSLICPDGNAVRQMEVILDQVGTYTLKYSAVVDGKPYGKEVTFDVRNGIISYSKEETKIGYRTCPYASDTETEYLTVALAQGDKITFNQHIDVTELTMNTPVVNMFVSPSARGVSDFDNFYYQLTDAENPDIYLKIKVNRYQTKSGQIYFLSGGNGQELKGYEGYSGKLHVNNDYGAPCTNSSMDGLNWAGNEIFVDEYDISVRYDYATRAVYGGSSAKAPVLVVDHDSTKYFETLWTGFPSGKVSLTMWAEGFNTANATFCLTEVYGIDLFSYGQKFEETGVPVLKVDTEYENMPEAKLGVAYPIPSATASDEYSGVCAVDVDVWYNYSSSNPVLVDVTDGMFIPNRKGYYTIIYTAKDRYNNVAQKALVVHAGASIDDIQLTPLTTPDNEWTLGEWVDVFTETDFEIKGGSGNKDLSITVSDGVNTYEVKDGFRPEKHCEWTITYTATDYIGSIGVYSYTVNTVLPQKPSVVDALVTPRLFISNSSYVLPVLYANDYTMGSLKKVLCEVEVSDANGTVMYKSGDKFIPRVENNGDEVTLRYKCGNELVDERKIKTILAFTNDGNGNKLQEQNYFHGEGLTAAKSADGVIITATEANGEWTFANALISEGLELALGNTVTVINEDEERTETVVKNPKFSGLELTLADAYAAENIVRMQVLKGKGVLQFNVYGSEKELEIFYDFEDENAGSLVLGFEDNAFTVNGTKIEVIKTVNGKEFQGFSAAKVYASLRFIEATEGAFYTVRELNGNPFRGRTRDQVTPTITVLGDYGGAYGLNSRYVIHSAVACDVLSPNVEFAMTVRAPDGTIVKDVNGLILDKVDPKVSYEIVLSQYGQYSINYVAREDKEFIPRPNGLEFPCGIVVVDKEKPNVEFKGDFQTTVKVGEALIIPDFSVSDNLTEVENIVIGKYVLNPNGVLVDLPFDSNSLIARYPGIYEFRIIVMDEIGNTKIIRVQVTVTE